MDYIKLLLKILSKIITIFIIIYALLVSPMLFNFRPLVILSGSMKPTIDIGTIIYIENKEPDESDIITYKLEENTLVTHRVIKKLEDGYITKGDANDAVDQDLVLKENVVGRVTKFKIPYIGYFVDYINKHDKIVIVSIIILLLDVFINRKNGEQNE